jgi:hypothetical protein
LTVELLEDRLTPATFGVPWPDAPQLTLSFAPDGTPVGTQQSQLFQVLGAVAPTSAWQTAILRAFQTWASQSNINIGLVADGGQPLGTAGPIQGDPRFGDIRVTATPMAPDAVALGLPFDVTAGTWSGSANLNSADSFGLGSGGIYDLYSVMLHEAGHVFGIDDSTDPASAMYAQYSGPRLGLTPGDVSAIQALYGVRQADQFDRIAPNETFGTATPIQLSGDQNGIRAVAAGADISALTDADMYRFKVDNNVGGITVSVHTAGISLLVPRLTVYDSSQHVIASVTSSGPLNGDLSVRLDSVQLGATYYVKVEGSTGDVFGIGGYRLEIRPDAAGATPPLVLGSPVVSPPSPHPNHTLGTAMDMRQPYYQANARFTYAVQAAITDPASADYYHFRSPQLPGNAPTVMTVLVWGTDVGGLSPALSLYDSHGNPVSADVLVNENGSYTVQVPNAASNADFYAAVRAATPSGAHSTGSYFLGMEFGPRAVNLQTFAGGTLTQSASQAWGTLQVNQSQVFHLVLSANSGTVPVDTGVRLTVIDQTGNVVATLDALNGETRSLTLFLSPGTYTFGFAAATRDGSPLPATTYSLRGLGVSDPIGPQLTDPSQSPGGLPQTPDQLALAYYWLMYGYYTALGLTGPFSPPPGT